jgi:hypothetical protein
MGTASVLHRLKRDKRFLTSVASMRLLAWAISVLLCSHLKKI